MTRRSTCLAAVGGLLLLAGALTACATPVGTAPYGGGTPSAAPSSSESAPVDSQVDAAWLDGGRVIGLVTSGSSTCVPAAADATVAGGVLAVTLQDPDPDQPCTRDYAPRVTVVEAPAGLDPTRDLQIAVSGSVVGTGQLAGVDGLSGGGDTDYLPSAGWTGLAGQFAMLTWGSSGCPPVVKDAAATGPAEVTVTFETPPADQVCTADMAPRAALASVDGLTSSGPVELVLTGDSFDSVRVPIIGTP